MPKALDYPRCFQVDKYGPIVWCPRRFENASDSHFKGIGSSEINKTLGLGTDIVSRFQFHRFCDGCSNYAITQDRNRCAFGHLEISKFEIVQGGSHEWPAIDMKSSVKWDGISVARLIHPRGLPQFDRSWGICLEVKCVEHQVQLASLGSKNQGCGGGSILQLFGAGSHDHVEARGQKNDQRE